MVQKFKGGTQKIEVLLEAFLVYGKYTKNSNHRISANVQPKT
jgi:hypothetical protein